MFGNLTPAEIEDVLKHEYIGRLGCHADDITYVVPISYAYDGVYVYGHTHEGMKVALMRKNPKVCFQADRMDNMANWQSVIAWSEYEELTQSEERNNARRQLLDRALACHYEQNCTTHLSLAIPIKRFRKHQGNRLPDSTKGENREV